MDRLVYFLNAVWILVYCLIITGAFGMQIFLGEVPCPLCYLQRVAMISVATAALLNLVHGVQMSHYGMAIFGSLVGGTVAFRQIALHICPAFPKFGIPFWGLSLYTWSFLTFVCSIALVGILLCLYRPSQSVKPGKLDTFGKFVAGYLVIVILGNIFSVLYECGLGICES